MCAHTIVSPCGIICQSQGTPTLPHPTLTPSPRKYWYKTTLNRHASPITRTPHDQSRCLTSSTALRAASSIACCRAAPLVPPMDVLLSAEVGVVVLLRLPALGEITTVITYKPCPHGPGNAFSSANATRGVNLLLLTSSGA